MRVHGREHEGRLHVYTLGLTKFDHPEVEVFGVAHELLAKAQRFMLGLAQSVLKGARLEPGALVGERSAPLKVAVGGLDREQWEGIPCLELIPESDSSPDAAIAAWVTSLER